MNENHFKNRDINIKIIKDTLNIIKHNRVLLSSVSDSIIKGEVYTGYPVEPGSMNSQKEVRYVNTIVEVTSEGSFEMARRVVKESDESYVTAVLNFASAKHPGGMVLQGSSAQEECLCRESTLFPVLANEKFSFDYYSYNKKLCKETGNSLYSNRAIYTPDIYVFKEHNKYIEDKDKWIKVSVITIPAPNIRNGFPKDIVDSYDKDTIEEYLDILYKERIETMLYIAEKNKVDNLILGAWGCGVFRNDPYKVAKAFRDRIITNYTNSFNYIGFPIYTKSLTDTNFKAFTDVFESF